MGKRGPIPRPTALKIVAGDRKDRINRNEPRPRLAEPEPPDWLTADHLAVWMRVIEELRAMRMAHSADSDALAGYCVAVVQMGEAARLVATAGVLIKGREGNVVKNPACAILRDATTMVRVLAREFGLTPSSRSNLQAEGESPNVSPAAAFLT